MPGRRSLAGRAQTTADWEPLFPCGGPVRGSHLVGREKEVEGLVDRLARGQSVVLAGPRRYGKTSVVHEVLAQLREQGLHTTFVDLFKVAEVADLADRLVAAALENGGFSGMKLVSLARQGIQKLKSQLQLAQLSGGGLEVLLEFAGSPDPRELLGSALDFPEAFAARHGSRAVVALDEVGELLNLDGPGLLKLMRAHCQDHQNTAYLFSGSQETLLTRLFTHKAQAFYGFARLVRLGPVAPEAWRPYITTTFKAHDLECPTEVVEGVLEVTGGHPYYTQYLCQGLFYGARGVKSAVGQEDLSRALKQTLDHHRAYFDELWGSLRRASYLQRGLARQLALEPEAPPYAAFRGRASNAAVYRALQGLVNKGVLGHEGKGRAGRGGRYRHLDPLFVLYLKEMA